VLPQRTHRWYRRDRGLTVRMLAAMTLVALADAGALLLLALLGVALWLVAAVGAAFLAAQLLLAPALTLASVGARRADAASEPDLHALVERLCQLADLPKPALAVAEVDAPIAFTVGRSPGSATVCVSSGLLAALDGPELAGVVAHELAHVASRDAAVMSVAALVPTLAGLGLRLAFWDGIPDDFEIPKGAPWWRRGLGVAADVASPATAFGMVLVRLLLVVPLVVAGVLYAITLPAVSALSRHRELAADRAAALLTGSPSSLASALLRLSGDLDQIPRSDLRSVALSNALLVMPAPPWIPGLARLTATHPPVERRVERLLALEARTRAT